MKRYFYTDPLAAAWMAKHFGMRFDVDMEDVLFAVYQFHRQQAQHLDISSVLPNISVTVTGRKIVAHPDSLHLLEPRVGDLCRFKHQRYGRITGDTHERVIGNMTYKVVEVEEYYEEASEFEAIIQRGGLSFFWPEAA
jgi:hypothetical protein